MKNNLLRAAGALVCAIALAAPNGAAHADTQRHQDPRGDVKTERFRAAARQPGIDISKVVNALEGDTLRMRVKVPDVAREYTASWAIKTGGRLYGVDVSRYRGSSAVTFYSLRGDTELRAAPRSDDAGRLEIDCAGVGLRTRGNSLVVTIDRSCIDDATHVRIATYTMRVSRNRFMVDDAWQKGFRRRQGFEYGPRLNLG